MKRDGTSDNSQVTFSVSSFYVLQKKEKEIGIKNKIMLCTKKEGGKKRPDFAETFYLMFFDTLNDER